MKKIKKILMILLLVCIYIPGSISTVSASGPVPLYEEITRMDVSLSINSSGRATCSTTVNTSNRNIEATMYLNQINGSRIKEVASWTLSDSWRLDETRFRYVDKGYDYQVDVFVTIKDSKGNVLESASMSSHIVHY